MRYEEKLNVCLKLCHLLCNMIIALCCKKSQSQSQMKYFCSLKKLKIIIIKVIKFFKSDKLAKKSATYYKNIFKKSKMNEKEYISGKKFNFSKKKFQINKKKKKFNSLFFNLKNVF